MQENTVHKDILGQPLAEGNYVAVSVKNSLRICQVTKLSPKMMRVIPVKKTGYWRESDGFLVYANQSVLLSGPDATAYILVHAGT